MSRFASSYAPSVDREWDDRKRVAVQAQRDQARASAVIARQKARQAMIDRGVPASVLPTHSAIHALSDADWRSTEERAARFNPAAKISEADFLPQSTPAAVTPVTSVAPTSTTAPRAPGDSVPFRDATGVRSPLAALPAPAALPQDEIDRRSMIGEYWRDKAGPTRSGVISRPGDAARIASKYGGAASTKAGDEPGYYDSEGKYLGAASYDNAGNVTSKMPVGATSFVGGGTNRSNLLDAVSKPFTVPQQSLPPVVTGRPDDVLSSIPSNIQGPTVANPMSLTNIAKPPPVVATGAEAAGQRMRAAGADRFTNSVVDPVLRATGVLKTTADAVQNFTRRNVSDPLSDLVNYTKGALGITPAPKRSTDPIMNLDDLAKDDLTGNRLKSVGRGTPWGNEAFQGF